MASDASEATSPPRAASLRRGWVVGLAALVVVALDQATKSWAVDRLSPEGSEGIHLWGDFAFRLAFNKGMAFSRFENGGPIIAVVALVIISTLVWFARSIHRRGQLLLVGIVIGGAAGNLVDRAVRSGEGFLGGRVVDFIYVRWWPTFNIADSAIVVGGILLAVLLTFHAEPEPEPDVEPEVEPARPGPDAVAAESPRADA